MNKIKISILFFLIFQTVAKACEACEKQQPAVTRGLTHGTGPQSSWDWVIVAIISLITLFTLYYSLKFLIKPGENNKDHIKNNVLNF
ncbi:hypothetical protein [Elizabethkingia sp. JS20170427COW]|uniref:hypothetical protein n=1 Tax=Elizabethkingia sp. JS20170427COW TaxID=2583851 RepID=UPI001110BEF5|nr:hypothetical protein [Elizabethkingia sp. JS20170427COW]QCX53893.1 hypothetical protein FGE20_09195 [Elizabethkingia sp. JS20170427COW]